MKKKILMVDDQPIMLKLLEQILHKKYNVTTMTDAKKALEWMHLGHLPDLVLLDLNMPGFSGFDFLKGMRLSAFFEDIPIIILSGEESSGDKIECLRLGANDYITKPFNPEELSLRVDNLLTLISNK